MRFACNSAVMRTPCRSKNAKKLGHKRILGMIEYNATRNKDSQLILTVSKELDSKMRLLVLDLGYP